MTSKCQLKFNLNQINHSQYNQNKTKIKLHMKAINYACFKLEEKPIRSVKMNKNNFINAIGDKFAMNTRQEKLAISFSKKLLSCVNYFQLLTYVMTLNIMEQWLSG